MANGLARTLIVAVLAGVAVSVLMGMGKARQTTRSIVTLVPVPGEGNKRDPNPNVTHTIDQGTAQAARDRAGARIDRAIQDLQNDPQSLVTGQTSTQRTTVAASTGGGAQAASARTRPTLGFRTGTGAIVGVNPDPNAGADPTPPQQTKEGVQGAPSGFVLPTAGPE